jgi:hypothetical protein
MATIRTRRPIARPNLPPSCSVTLSVACGYHTRSAIVAVSTRTDCQAAADPAGVRVNVSPSMTSQPCEAA